MNGGNFTIATNIKVYIGVSYKKKLLTISFGCVLDTVMTESQLADGEPFGLDPEH